MYIKRPVQTQAPSCSRGWSQIRRGSLSTRQQQGYRQTPANKNPWNRCNIFWRSAGYCCESWKSKPDGQLSVAPDYTIASTSPKRNDTSSVTLEKVLKPLDEPELKLERHHSRPKHQYFDDRRRQPSRLPAHMNTNLVWSANILMNIVREWSYA